MRGVFMSILLLLTLSACASPQTIGGPFPVPTGLSGDQFCKRFDLASVNRISNTNFVAVRTETAPGLHDGSMTFGCTFVGAGVDVNNADAVLLANSLGIDVVYEASRAATDQDYGKIAKTILAQPSAPPCASDPNGGWHRTLTISGLSAIEVFACHGANNRPANLPFGLLIRKDTIWFDIAYTGPGDLEAAGRYAVSRVP